MALSIHCPHGMAGSLPRVHRKACSTSLPVAGRCCKHGCNLGGYGLRWTRSQQAAVHRSLRTQADVKDSQPAAATTQPESASPQGAQQQAEVVEATNVIDPNSQASADLDVLPRMPDSVTQQATITYTAIAAVYGIMGASLIGASQVVPALLLPPSVMQLGAIGPTLLGLTGVAFLKAAALSVHLQISVGLGELGTWRHQRMNGALAVFGAAVAVSALAAATSASPVATGLLVVAPAACAAACALVARSAWAHGPWVQWAIEPDNWSSTFHTFLLYLKRDVTSLTGIAALTLLIVSAHGAWHTLATPSAWGFVAPSISAPAFFDPAGLWPYGTSPAAASTLWALRRVCGAGLLVGAFSAHALLEAAHHVRELTVREMLAKGLNLKLAQAEKAMQTVAPTPERYELLAWLGVVVAGIAQAALLLAAPGLGVDVNQDAALMGPLHWSVLASFAFAVLARTGKDWRSVRESAQAALEALFGFLRVIVNNVFLRPEWRTTHKL